MWCINEIEKIEDWFKVWIGIRVNKNLFVNNIRLGGIFRYIGIVIY